MGTIKPEVQHDHLATYPEELSWLRAFLPEFDVTWARARRQHNSPVSAYFLDPLAHTKEMFGFTQELLLIYTRFTTLEPRALQAAEAILYDAPARGRTERLTYLIVSEMPATQEWVSEYLARNPENRVVVGFCAEDLRNAATRGDTWWVRNALRDQLFGRDLFDYRLPLTSDTYFFGRSQVVLELRDTVMRGENRGLFGLRKSGKTSVVFKLKRAMEAEGSAHVLYFDCKRPQLRMRRWHDLLDVVGRSIATAFARSWAPPASPLSCAEQFTDLTAWVSANGDRSLALVFDEIEYISPLAIMDRHWAEQDDYLNFWQTMWSAQSHSSRVSLILCGVNGTVAEVPQYHGVQNPLFGIVAPLYLVGFGAEDLRTMLRTLGRRVGMKFDDASVHYLLQRYGGHPLLTRLACSHVYRSMLDRRVPLPENVTTQALSRDEEQRDADLAFYCEHVVSEVRDFYRDEYTVLEMLAVGEQADVQDLLGGDPSLSRHLRQYGLLGHDESHRVTIQIPVVAKYIGLEDMRRQGRATIIRAVSTDRREGWVRDRLRAIVDDLREVQKASESAAMPSIYGPNSVPDTHLLFELKQVSSEDGFATFINRMNKSFVEAMELYARSTRVPNYLEAIWQTYPAIRRPLSRIKVYRHERMHLRLYPQVQSTVADFLRMDLAGASNVPEQERWFVLQQCVLDDLLAAIQVTLSRLT